MADRPLIDDSLVLLNLCGLINYETNSRNLFKKIFLTIVILTSYADILLYTFVNWNEPGSIENILLCFGFGQVTIKTCVYKSRYVLQTLEEMKKFYPLTRDDLKLKRETINGEMFTKIRSLLKFFLVFFFLVLVLFIAKSFMATEKQLPYGSFVFRSKESPILEVGYFYEVLVIVICAPAQVGFDVLYLSLVTNIIYEFRLLKKAFAELPISRNPESDAHTLDVLANLINHHGAILDCSKALRRTYYIPFLCIFVCDMIIIGFCLLCIIANGFTQNMGIFILYGMCAVFYTLQLFLYCAPGTILILESTEVSDVIFSTDWWIKTQPRLRKAYVRILQRANRPVLLSAGGMMNVTLQSFSGIMKNTLSFFTCVLAIFKKND